MIPSLSAGSDSGLCVSAPVNYVQAHAPDGLDEALILQYLRGFAESVAGDLVFLLHLDGGGDPPTWGDRAVLDLPPEMVGDLAVRRYGPLPVDDHVRTLARHPWPAIATPGGGMG